MRVRLHTQQTTNFSTHSKSSLTNGVDQSQDFIRALQWQREELWVKRGQALDQSFGLGDITLLTQNLAGFKILDLKEKHMTCRKTNCSWPVQKKQTDEDWSVPGCNLLSVWGHPCGVIFEKKKMFTETLSGDRGCAGLSFCRLLEIWKWTCVSRLELLPAGGIKAG